MPPAAATSAADSSSLAAGTELTIKLLEVIDSDAPFVLEYVSAEVPEDIHGADGKLAFPAGSHALLVVRQAGRDKSISTLVLALYSIFVGNRQVKFIQGNRDLATVAFNENAGDGAQHRTVHLADDTLLHFKLQSTLSLK